MNLIKFLSKTVIKNDTAAEASANTPVNDKCVRNIYIGTTDPNNSVGANGDVYLQYDN